MFSLSSKILILSTSWEYKLKLVSRVKLSSLESTQAILNVKARYLLYNINLCTKTETIYMMLYDLAMLRAVLKHASLRAITILMTVY